LFTQNCKGYPIGGAAFSNEYHLGLVAGITAMLLMGLLAIGFECVAHAVDSESSKCTVNPLFICITPFSLLMAISYAVYYGRHAPISGEMEQIPGAYRKIRTAA
jgi:hypothetical protein